MMMMQKLIDDPNFVEILNYGLKEKNFRYESIDERLEN